ncbi:LysR substrate-binding domain-containing protein [Agrococcus carbonis]|uniref:DNA-binding transcriptional regulator, LysR family n=1 Tax=Agrococcus carbonis TaxID=684552 RepID=A0A1H1R2V2_9MICO|nr:LysR substrate-binding domain-containing protein [Agrococcus carbonis]SDS29960.1 DNA-binding transcriptional regulator, LysR family [Agrococcus carbonis]
MLDVRRLRLLRELRLRGTIAAVAAALAYAPSAVSQQLSALEREVGVALTRKQGRRLALTPQGELLAAHAERILAQLEAAERAVAASLGRPVGTVRIAVFQSAALSLVPEMLRILAGSAPEVRVEMVQREPETALYDTHVGDFDLVVAEQYPGHAAPQHPGLDREVLMTDALRLAVPPGSGIRTLADAAARAWVMEPVGAASRHFAEQQCRLAGFEPDVRFATADLQAQMRLIETGHAVGIVNDLTWVGSEVGFEALPLPGEPRREIFTAGRTASSGSPAIAAVRQALRDAVPQLDDA